MNVFYTDTHGNESRGPELTDSRVDNITDNVRLACIFSNKVYFGPVPTEGTLLPLPRSHYAQLSRLRYSEGLVFSTLSTPSRPSLHIMYGVYHATNTFFVINYILWRLERPCAQPSVREVM